MSLYKEVYNGSSDIQLKSRNKWNQTSGCTCWIAV